MFSTGIPACDLLQEVAFSGNVIPQIWYRVFVKADLKHPKPHLLAINLLADIVYWYRPREIRDEGTGQVIGLQKKFRDDMLQRSYAQIAEQFGCSSGQAKDAVVFLEHMGVVRREFRSMQSGGLVYANILYLDLDVNRLKELTYPSAEISPDGCPEDSDGASDDIPSAPVSAGREGCAEISRGVCRNFTTPPVKFPQGSAEISHTPLLKFPRTNTENTTKTSTEISAEISIHPSSHAEPVSTSADGQTDGQTDAQISEQVIAELETLRGIPESYLRSPKKIVAAVRWLCEFDYYRRVPIEKTEIRTVERWDNYVLLLNSLAAMLTQRGTQVYSGEETNAHAVLEALNSAENGFGCGTLSELMFEALDDYSEALESTHIKNYGGYAKAVLWNCLTAHRVRQNVKYAVM